jgi:C4-type Zn-finger protein
MDITRVFSDGLKIQCKVCQSELSAELRLGRTPYDYKIEPYITVEPCSKCMEEAETREKTSST